MPTKKKVEEVVEKEVEEVEEVEEKKVEASSALTAGGDADDFDFAEGIEGGEMTLSQIPTLKLTQNMTPEVTSRDFPDIYAGMYINDVTKEVIGESVEFRLISMWKQRVKFPPRDSGTTSIECSCPTANNNFIGDTGTTYGPCKTCVFNNFSEKEHCQPQYTMIVALNNNPHDLYRIILSRTSYKSGSTFANAMQGQLRRFAKEKLPMFMFTGMLNAKQVTNNKMGAKYYISEVQCVPAKEVPTMDDELKEEFIQTFKEIRALRNRQIEVAAKIAADNAAERKEANENSEEFQAINSNIADELGFAPEEGEEALKAKSPF